MFGFDPTPKSINWIKNQHLPVGFNFYEYGINNETGVVKFYLPINPDFVSGSIIDQKNVTTENSIDVQMKSFHDIVTDLGHQKIDILKMDIEGAEFNVLKSLFDPNILIDQILIEFHERFLPKGKIKLKNAIKFLQLEGYEIFAISETLEEYSFIRRNAL